MNDHPSWLSRSFRSLVYSFPVYFCHICIISFASVKSILFPCSIVPTFTWNVPLVSLIFLKRFLVFPILLFPSISLHWLLRKAFLPLLVILWNSAFRWIYISFSLYLSLLFFPQLFVRPPSSGNHFAFCIYFSWGRLWSRTPVKRYEASSIVLQAPSLSDLIPWIYLSLDLI